MRSWCVRARHSALSREARHSLLPLQGALVPSCAHNSSPATLDLHKSQRETLDSEGPRQMPPTVSFGHSPGGLALTWVKRVTGAHGMGMLQYQT